MAWLANEVLDAALTYIDTNAENLYICSQEPTTYAAAQTTYKLGTKALDAASIAAVGEGSPNGRSILVAAITDGTVNATGTATHFAITDNSASLLLATGALSASQSVTSGNTFSLTSFTVRIPDPA